MPTQIRTVGDMPVEERLLDNAGEQARAELNARVLSAYDTGGFAAVLRLCEAALDFEAYAAEHVLPD